MDKVFTMIVKGPVDISPTAINVLLLLKEIYPRVVGICSSCSTENHKMLEAKGIELHCIEPNYKRPASFNIPGKVFCLLQSRQKIWALIKKLGLEDSMFWVARIDTAVMLGGKLKKVKYILGLHELHDRFPLYQRMMSFYIRHACKVVVPEYNRAVILRVWHNCKETPSVLPNKPVIMPVGRNIEVSDKNAREIIEREVRGRKIILYQGALTHDRDLIPMAEAMEELDDSFCFLVMGRDNCGILDKLKKVCSKIVYIPWVIPPGHLEITSHAYIGIACYDFDALNSVYCAPNKIWEYTGLELPMLCQDVPGLQYTVAAKGAGICVNIHKREEILKAVEEISQNYDKFRKNAVKFYNSIDMLEIMRKITAEALK